MLPVIYNIINNLLYLFQISFHKLCCALNGPTGSSFYIGTRPLQDYKEVNSIVEIAVLMDEYKANCCIMRAPLNVKSADRLLHYTTFWKNMDEEMFFFDSSGEHKLEGPFPIYSEKQRMANIPCPKDKKAIFFTDFAVNRSISFFNIPMDPIRLQVSNETKIQLKENLDRLINTIFIEYLLLPQFGLTAPGMVDDYKIFSKNDSHGEETIFKDNLISVKPTTLRSHLTGK
jgi:hypothetical protein